MQNTPLISIKNLTVSYDRKVALRSVNLDVVTNGVIGIIGPNGAGKSTLIKGILQLIAFDSGRIRIFGKPVEDVRKDIAYVPQKESIDWDFPVTVADLVMMGRYAHLNLFQWPSAEDRRIVDESLDRVGMIEYKDRQIGQLSGGQQQRIFIARALAQQADIFLLDEPFVGVDASTETTIINLIKEVNRTGRLIIIVHHDLSKVTEYFDQLIMINQRLIAFGPTDEVFTPEMLKRTYGGRLTILQKSETILGGH